MNCFLAQDHKLFSKIACCVLAFAVSDAVLVAAQPQSGKPIEIQSATPGGEWFEDAKLGIFMHWGMYAVDGTVESWPFNQPPEKIEAEEKCIPRDEYYSQMPRFAASNYDPAKWAEVFRQAGAKYAIITTKHHDGFALWDSQVPGALTAVRHSPAGRDLIAPWVEAMRANGIRPGFYFSLADWHHPDYPSMRVREDMKGKRSYEELARINPYSYSTEDDPQRWERFLDFMYAQIEELIVHQPDIWWFDGGWERSKENWHGDRLSSLIMSATPNAIVGRSAFWWPKGAVTYATPERVIPMKLPGRMWELCLTSNEHWSYRPTDEMWKSAGLLVQLFSETIGRGGNLLLNIGPKADGTLPDEATQPLLEMGDWIRRNAEAIYGTVGGEPHGISFNRFYGPSTLARDGKTLYLFVHGMPRDGVLLRGVVSVPKSVSVLATGQKLPFRQLEGNKLHPGHILIHAPENPDPLTTILKLEFDHVIELGI